MLFSRAFIKSSFLTINPCRKFQILNILNHYLGFTEGNISPLDDFEHCDNSNRQLKSLSLDLTLRVRYVSWSVSFLIWVNEKPIIGGTEKKKQQWEINKSLLTQIQSFLIRLKNKNNKISATNTDYKEKPFTISRSFQT